MGLRVKKVATTATARVIAPNPTPIARSAFSSAMIIDPFGRALYSRNAAGSAAVPRKAVPVI